MGNEKMCLGKFSSTALVIDTFYLKYCSLLVQHQKFDLKFGIIFLSKYKNCIFMTFHATKILRCQFFLGKRPKKPCLLNRMLWSLRAVLPNFLNAFIILNNPQCKHLISLSFQERKFFYIFLKNQSLRLYGNLRKILSSTFIYEPILITIYMNANIMNATLLVYKPFLHYLSYNNSQE